MRERIAVLLEHTPPLRHRDIAAEVGCSPALVSKVARELGLARPRGGPRLISPHRDRAREMHANGQSLAAIGAELGLSRERVRQLLID